MKRQGGFTLLELVVALSLIAVLSLALFMALRVSLSAYRKGQERIAASQRENVIIDLVKVQIGSAYPARPQGKFLEPLRQRAGQADPNTSPGFLERLVAARAATPPLFRGEARSVLFASFAPLFFRKNAGMSMIAYSLVPGEQGELRFLESEEQYHGGDTFLEMSAGTKGEQTVFFDGLERGEFEYFGEIDNDASWRSEWDGEEIGRLPTAIRITLERRGGQRVRIVGLINADALAPSAVLGGGIVPPNLRTIIGGGVP
jgi:prepilin-type N-terminal cleavage/methylation domain-containing protein